MAVINEDFKLIRNNRAKGFITDEEFINQWDEALREKGLSFGDDVFTVFGHIRSEYARKLHELVDDILDRQGWLADI